MRTRTLYTEQVVPDQPQPVAEPREPRPVKPEKKAGIKIDPAVCPARCKRSGLCYGRAWFLGKSGPAMPCNPKQCRWEKSLQETLQERI
jgi:hypothetical protein